VLRAVVSRLERILMYKVKEGILYIDKENGTLHLVPITPSLEKSVICSTDYSGNTVWDMLVKGNIQS
jgi:hypothetical protein